MIWITFLTGIPDGSLSLRCKCRSIFDCSQRFLTVSLYTVIEASLELCSLLTFNLLHLSDRRTLGMIHHSFHIDSFSTIVEFACNSLTTTCYLRLFSVLISPKIFVYPVNRVNIPIRRNRFMSSLKVPWLSLNGFSKRVYALNCSPRRIDNRSRRSNYPPKRALNFPAMGLNFPPKRLIYPPKRLSCKAFPHKRLM